MAVQYMRKAIQKKAHFDIMDLDTVQVISMYHFKEKSRRSLYLVLCSNIHETS